MGCTRHKLQMSLLPTLVLHVVCAVLQMRGLGCTWQGGVLLWCTQGQVSTDKPFVTLFTSTACHTVASPSHKLGQCASFHCA
jgi:hypothetical protein